MYSRILILRFPQTEVHKPIVANLVKDYGLLFTILNATILPRREGIMVMELMGPKKKFKDGVEYLKSQGVKVQNASQEVDRDTDRCTHCGACTAVCPTGALHVERPEMRVDFQKDKCSVCQLCIAACPARCMKVKAVNDGFF